MYKRQLIKDREVDVTQVIFEVQDNQGKPSTTGDIVRVLIKARSKDQRSNKLFTVQTTISIRYYGVVSTLPPTSTPVTSSPSPTNPNPGTNPNPQPQINLRITNFQVATASTGTDTLTVSRSPVTDATSYELQYKASTTSIYNEFSGTKDPTGTVLTGLTAGTTYNIQVRALKENTPPGPYNAITGTTTGTAPPEDPTPTLAQVTGLTLSVLSNSQIKASWNEITGCLLYTSPSPRD